MDSGVSKVMGSSGHVKVLISLTLYRGLRRQNYCAALYSLVRTRQSLGLNWLCYRIVTIHCFLRLSTGCYLTVGTSGT